jgi:hypothetical protein
MIQRYEYAGWGGFVPRNEKVVSVGWYSPCTDNLFSNKTEFYRVGTGIW